MASTSAPAPESARRWLDGAGAGRAWVHALCAFVVGAVFAVFLRNLAIAALAEGGVFYLLAALTGLIAAIAFGALGRAFTGKGSAWLLALTVLAWAPAAGVATFVIFAREGEFEPLNPTVPAVGGIVAVVFALLAHRGVPRVVGLVLAVLAIAGVVAAVVAVP
jgi:hypothetical protein